MLLCNAGEATAQSCSQVEIRYDKFPCADSAANAHASIETKSCKRTTVCVAQSYFYSVPATWTNVQWEAVGPGTVAGLPIVSAPSINISFPTPGAYTLTVTATDAGGNISTNCLEITAVDKPDANFTYSPTGACAGTPVQFNNLSSYNGGGMAYLWDFDDPSSGANNISTQNSPSHSFNAPGTYNVRLIVYSTAPPLPIKPGAKDTIPRIRYCCGDTFYQQVVIAPGNVQIECIKTVCPNTEESYTVTGCSGPSWNVSGGTITAQNSSTIKVTWGNGDVPTTIGVQCSGGCPATITIPVIPQNPVPQGNITPCLGTIESYSLPFLPGTFYTWNLTRGGVQQNNLISYSTDRNVAWINWSAATAGDYILTVELDNKHLCCSFTGSITINLRPEFTIEAQKEGCEVSPIPFYPNPYNANPTWTVDRTDVTIPPPPFNPFRPTFNGTGLYVITATVTSGAFCNTTASATVNIHPQPPKPDPISGPEQVCVNNAYTYSLPPAPAGHYYEWSFWGGAYGTFQPPNGYQGDEVIVKWGANIPPAGAKLTAKLCSRDPIICCSDTSQLIVTPINGIVLNTGATVVCADAEEIYSIQTVLPPGTDIVWTVTPSAAGSIVSGQGTSTVTIKWHGPGRSNVIVKAQTSCGTAQINNININIPTSGTITESGSNFCTNYSLSVGGSGPYQWYRNGNAISGNTNSIQITQGGSYAVSYVNNGCRVTATRNVADMTPCNVSITTPSKRVYCPQETINVTLSATLSNACGNYTYEWFRDNVSLGSNTPSIQTLNTGTYFVRATLGNCTALSNSIVIARVNCDGDGCTDCDEDIKRYTISGCNPVTFSETYTTGPIWVNYGDGSPIGEINNSGSHTYTDPGWYHLFIQTPCVNYNYPNSPCVQWWEDSVLVPFAPDFSFNINCAVVGFIDETQIFAGSGNIVWRGWDFGDNTANTATTSNAQISHTYTNSGMYTIKMKIVFNRTPGGLCDTFEVVKQIIITAGVPSVAVNDVCVNSVTEFSTTVAPVLSYEWRFDANGPFGYEQTATCVYTTTGNKTVRLKIIDFEGCVSIKDTVITILNAPAQFTIRDTFVCPGGEVALQGPVGTGYQYTWEVCNGANCTPNGGTGQTHVFTAAGTYRLKVSLANGCSFTSNIFEIKEAPSPDALINVSPSTQLCEINAVVNLSTSWIASNSCKWYQGGLGSNPIAGCFYSTPLAAGTTFWLVKTNGYGCHDTCSVDINVNPVAGPYISANPWPYCEGTDITLTASACAAGTNLSWSTGETTSQIVVNGAGVYSAICTDPTTGCTGKDNLVINPRPPAGLFPHFCDSANCECNTPYLIYAPQPLTVTGYSSIAWIVDNAPATSTLPDAFEALLGNHTYQVVLADQNGCKDTSEVYSLYVPECIDCTCDSSSWGEIILKPKSGAVTTSLTCNNTQRYMLTCGETYTVESTFECRACTGAVNYRLQTPGGALTGSGPSIVFVPGVTGTYTLTIYGSCDETRCDSCKIIFYTNCDSIPENCCMQENEITVTINNGSLDAASENGNDYSLQNLSFSLSAGTTLYQEVKVEVVDYQLSAAQQECIPCQKKPFTWASISAGQLAGITPLITGASSGTVPSHPMENPREIVWNNGSAIDLSAALVAAVQLHLPAAVNNPCCELVTRVCFKITFKDINCNTCEKYICETFKIPSGGKKKIEKPNAQGKP